MASGTPTSPAFPLSVGGSSAAGGAGIGSPLSGGAPSAAPTASSAFHSATSASGVSGNGSRPATPSSSGLGSMGGITVEEVRRWSQADVGAWLHSLRLGAHAGTFAAHDISGAVLLDVEQAELKEMGLTSIGDRIRVFTAIKNLKKRCAESAAMATMARNMSPVMTRAGGGIAAGGGAGEMEYLQQDDGSMGYHHASPLGALNGTNGRRAVHSRPPPLHLSQSSAHDLPTTPTAPSPVSSLNGGQGLGLKEMRGLAQQAGGRLGSARSPGVPPKGLPDIDGAAPGVVGHRKMASTAGMGTSAAASFAQHVSAQQAAGRSYGYGTTSRPSTATGASSSSYMPTAAAAGRSMPSGAATSPTSATHAPPQRPSTSDGAARLHSGAPTGRPDNPLTPITEGSLRSPTTPSFSGSGSATTSRSNDRGYAVRHGPFSARAGSSASSPASVAAAAAQARQAQQEQLATYGFPPPSLEDLKRRTIKFIDAADGTTRIVNVSDCRDAHDVLARVLKKFGKSSAGNSYAPTAGQVEEERELEDGEVWGIFATSGEGKTKSLTDNELLAICHAPQPHDPLRERGLTLRRLARPDSGRATTSAPKRNKLESFFGERLPSQAPASPHFADEYDDDAALDAAFVQPTGKKLNRASTVSIMSGLGVVPGNKSGKSTTTPSNSSNRLAPDSQQQHRSPTSVIPRKARNFFGQRPPSELISSHLTDYFPQAEKRVLERTARRSIYGRPSASVRSKRDSTWSFSAELDAPPLPGKESIEGGRPTPSIHIGTPEHSDDETAEDRTQTLASSQQGSARPGPPTLPPVIGRSSLDDWSKSLQTVGSPVEEGAPAAAAPSRPTRPLSQRRASGESTRSRRSLATQLRVARGIGGAPGHRASMVDRSDAASMLTVDEITQEVEMRRASTSLVGAGAGWVVDEDGVPIPAPANAASRGGSGSIVGSTRPSSHLSAGAHDDADSDTDPDAALFGAPKTTPAQRRDSSSPAPSVPGEESDQHRGDPMAVVRGTTSRASSVHELRQEAGGEETATADDDEIDSDDDYDEDDDVLSEEEDEDGGVFHSAVAGRGEPIKWIKGALIGAGSFGNVFLGMNAKNGLLMAVKQVELPSGDSGNEQRKKSMLEALEREIELLKTMQHENIVQYLDSSADGTHLNIFLEYVPGGSVVALLRNYGAFEELLVRNFVRQILQGLSYLHAREIVHRDIKGANILVDNKSCVKISDFGISKKVESDLLVNAKSHRPSLQGSVFWMAPEVVKQTSYTRKADIWSLGCLVVEMISGTHPWANLNQMQALFKIGKGTRPETPDDISHECIDFLNATFELDHNDRPSADELLQHAFITGEYTGPASGGADATAATNTPATATATSATATNATPGSTLDEGMTAAGGAAGSTLSASTATTATTSTGTLLSTSGGTSTGSTTNTPASSVRARKKDAAARRAAKDAVLQEKEKQEKQASEAAAASTNAGEGDD